MSWLKRFQNIFKGVAGNDSVPADASHAGVEAKKIGEADVSAPDVAPDILSGKGIPAFFYRKWKDPAFLKQMRVLAARMQKDGVDIKSMSAVKAWIEKNKEAIESGKIEAVEDQPQGKATPYVKSGPNVSRNDPCSCGSGKKYKKCCASKAE
jgi:hypothetical protein